MVKEKTEALKEQIAGIGQLQVFIAPAGTSTHSFMLEGLFDSVEALDCYQVPCPVSFSHNDIILHEKGIKKKMLQGKILKASISKVSRFLCV